MSIISLQIYLGHLYGETSKEEDLSIANERGTRAARVITKTHVFSLKRDLDG